MSDLKVGGQNVGKIFLGDKQIFGGSTPDIESDFFSNQSDAKLVMMNRTSKSITFIFGTSGGYEVETQVAPNSIAFRNLYGVGDYLDFRYPEDVDTYMDYVAIGNNGIRDNGVNITLSFDEYVDLITKGSDLSSNITVILSVREQTN